MNHLQVSNNQFYRQISECEFFKFSLEKKQLIEIYVNQLKSSK